jgi:hypothetical protein
VALYSRQNKLAVSRAVYLLTILLFTFFLKLVWYPEFKRDYVPREIITQRMIEQGRTQPPDAMLEEMRSHRLLEYDWPSEVQLIGTAEKLLRGRAEIPGFEPVEIQLPFAPSDLDRGSGQWQLHFAGLIVPETFLDAYEHTGRQEFYEAARDTILAWARFERKAWLDKGFLWNDHAVASRARTLADFWNIYRRRPDYRSDVAAELWGFAARTGAFLAKPEQYNFATNHGVMQNLALWQICLAFPSLPRAEEYKQTALSRLRDQLSFFVGPDGVILEHSAGYHESGLFLFGLVLRYATLLHLDVPPEWSSKYKKAESFYDEIRRPDGSLPPFGDTWIGMKKSGVRIAQPDQNGRFGPLTSQREEKPRESFGLYPVAGYAVFWDGLQSWPSLPPLSQTLLSWSYYSGHGHKHADETSVLLWAKGHEWWTNAGYWSYEDPDRRHAECWEGSNAPHLVGEECTQPRTSNLLTSLQLPGLLAAEMERRGPDALVVRRLVIHAATSIWVLVDECIGAPKKNLQTIWTAAPNVRVEPGTVPGMFGLFAEGVPGQLRAYFLGPASLTIRNLRGNRDPFAGWAFAGGKPQPTEAVVTEQSAAGAWAVTIWVLDDNASLAGSSQSQDRVLQWNDARSWKILLPLKTGSKLISRQGETISIDETFAATRRPIVGVLEAPPVNVAAQIAALHANYEVAALRYPRFRDLFLYRLRASALGLMILAFQELFLTLYRRMGGAYVTALRVLSLFGWLGLSTWVSFFYLRSP